MADRPILFSGPMVRAILGGRKTQTRRVVKNQPVQSRTDPAVFGWWAEDGCMIPTFDADGDEGPVCHYGVPGDRLWVRETFNNDWTDHVIYRADGGSAVEAGWPREPKWRPSIFMPRAACRLVLEVTAVRVERLQQIREADVHAEGCQLVQGEDARWHYGSLWNSLNAKRGFGWDTNPWVWVIEFNDAR